MSVEIPLEDAIRIRDAAALVPRGPGGRAVHPATVMRWIKGGLKAADGRVVRLAAARFGASWFTSKGALEAFAAELAAPPPTAPPRPTAAVLRRRIDRATRDLERQGVLPRPVSRKGG